MKKILMVLSGVRWFFFLVVESIPLIGQTAMMLWAVFAASPVAAALLRAAAAAAEAFPFLTAFWTRAQPMLSVLAIRLWDALLFYVPLFCLVWWIFDLLKIGSRVGHLILIWRTLFRDMHRRRRPQQHLILLGHSDSGDELSCDLGDKGKVVIPGSLIARLEKDGVHIDDHGRQVLVPLPGKYRDEKSYVQIDAQRYELETVIQTI